ncbi:tellurium resistance protein [Thioclava sp. SK-1]|uniref:TDT family transporter n=1 Tax=Thioclava sp. SK-1 TaxID=1889770 RepID=UPI00159F1FE1|nr:tellurium resistance protein [Thioclava sp. SK-1]
MPPAIFPVILGLMGLGFAWKQAAQNFGVPNAVPAIVLGALTVLAIAALLAYVVKFAQRPSVVLEDLAVLPGRLGMSCAVLLPYLLSLVIAPYAPVQAVLILVLAMVVQAAFNGALIFGFVTGPSEQRRVDAIWHLAFGGWIVGAATAHHLGMTWVAALLFWGALLTCVSIWVITLQQMSRDTVTAALRPILALHLAPAACLGIVSTQFHAEGMSQAFGLMTVLGVILLVLRGRWMARAGATALWGALIFPLATTAGFWLLMAGIWALPGAGLLAVATLVALPISLRMLREWLYGRLAHNTNAAIA